MFLGIRRTIKSRNRAEHLDPIQGGKQLSSSNEKKRRLEFFLYWVRESSLMGPGKVQVLGPIYQIMEEVVVMAL